jgi:hypothetical protein
MDCPLYAGGQKNPKPRNAELVATAEGLGEQRRRRNPGSPRDPVRRGAHLIVDLGCRKESFLPTKRRSARKTAPSDIAVLSLGGNLSLQSAVFVDRKAI